MLYWAAAMNSVDYVAFFLEKKVSPFITTFNG
jgi:hypothetical protein